MQKKNIIIIKNITNRYNRMRRKRYIQQIQTLKIRFKI
jgi:hypothetical protein